MQYQKAQSVSKKIQTKGARLEATILETMKTISDIVGATLGPGGRQVLIERQEHGLPPMVTKDGVTVFRSLGFDDAARQCIMEAARDASIRTASEAGDGTTTATILSHSIVKQAFAYAKANPRVSPQRIVRRLESIFREVIEPEIKKLSVKADLTSEEGRNLLHSVAAISANGDQALADAIMACFDLVGDDGNVTIAELPGPSSYQVERIEGYPIMMGYEESCQKFYPKFVNDVPNQKTTMEKPYFVIYHGKITDVQSLMHLFSKIGYNWESNGGSHEVVLVSTGFSEQVLGYLATQFGLADTLKVFPLVAPQSPFANGQMEFLLDLAAVTGATMADVMNLPLDQVEIEHMGQGSSFESFRFRSNVVGKGSEDLLLLRVDELKIQIDRSDSMLDKTFLQERLGKLTGGIAKLKISGPSNGETKEKKDRADDAVCAVRGAIKHGCLPGGGWTLLKLMALLQQQNDPIVQNVLVPALFEPFRVLLENVGVTEHNPEEFQAILGPILHNIHSDTALVYDVFASQHVNAFEHGILDSTPAVLEAIRNSLSIASLLGTLGGTVVFARDTELERQNALDKADFERNANVNLADERA